MFAKRRVLGHLALGLLIFGAQACDQSKSETAGGGVPPGEEGFEQTSFALISAGCVVNSTTQVVAFTVGANESLYMFKRTADGQVVANANLSTNSSAECAFPPSYRVTVANVASTNTHKVLFDFIGGTFGMATAASTGTGTNPGPNLVVTLTGTGNTVKIRGTSSWEVYTFGTVSTTSYGSFNVGTATAAPATARTFPDLSMTGVQNLVVATGAGNDVITAQGGAPVGASSLALDGTIGIDVYGGDGNDTITSGALSSGGAQNHLYGMAGDDLFIQGTVKARDNISGSDSGGPTDSDTVDYSLRTMPLSVTLGDDALIGVTSMGSVNCATQANTSDHEMFSINDGTNPVVTYEYQKTPVVPSTGSVTTTAQTNYADHDTLVLDDGVHTAVTFEYAVSAASGTLTLTTPGDRWIDISAATSANDVAIATYTAIAAANSATFTIAATDPMATAVVALSNPAGYNATVVRTGTGNTVAGMASGVRFVPTSGSNVVIDVSSSSVVTAADVCTATGAAIWSMLPAGVSATISTNQVLIAIMPMAFKPPGAVITKVTSGAMFTVTDFSAGTALGANDGESGELDSIDNSVENIIGGSAADTLDASHASLTTHILVGMNGNDTLIGSNMADTLWGGLGDDTLKGGGGVDALNGGDGNDVMQGGLGNDAIDGGGFNCSVVPATQPTGGLPAVPATTSCTTAAAAKSTVAGVNPGINTLDFSDRSSAVSVVVDLTNVSSTSLQTGATGEKDVVTFVTGTTGPSTVQYLRGGAGNDTLTGDGLANIIWGGDGNDIINGGGGNDAIYGEGGNDTIHGDAASLPMGQVAGDDFISGGMGMNTIFGDAGNDLIDNTAGTSMGSIDCGIGDSDVGMTSAFGDTTVACELN
ncbi:MAG TPA: hypothetical protein VGP07_12080 [Polyangia bacterium]|jgi:hypothetical protein